MKCPFRINKVHDVSVYDVTKVNMEFAECYEDECAYWGQLDYNPNYDEIGCRKVQAEVTNG